MKTRLIPENQQPVASFNDYSYLGGGTGLKKARSMEPQEILDQIAASGLRGRGGAGFPTAKKWLSVYEHECLTKYVCANGAEGEPGTFKDRYLMRMNPYLILEGLAIAAHVIKPKKTFIAVKRIFNLEIESLQRARKEMVEAGLIDEEMIEISFGPDDYLFGEEKGMMEVLEGRRAIPRQLPPHEMGLFSNEGSANPTLVNNVETLSNIPLIMSKGPHWFRELGSEASPGTMIFTISGDIQKPGIYELPLGTPFKELLKKAGGPLNKENELECAFSGVANPVLMKQKFETPLDFDALKEASGGLGSGGFIVYDSSACPVAVAHTLSWFLSEESCGQCVSCKTGCVSITECLGKLEQGNATEEDLEEIKKQLDLVENGRMCYLAAQENNLIRSICHEYWPVFKNHVIKKCENKRKIGLPKMNDFNAKKNEFIYDMNYRGKSLIV